jgi:hypothetical protein
VLVAAMKCSSHLQNAKPYIGTCPQPIEELLALLIRQQQEADKQAGMLKSSLE